MTKQIADEAMKGPIMTDYSELIDHLENRGDDSCTDAATAIRALIAAHESTHFKLVVSEESLKLTEEAFLIEKKRVEATKAELQALRDSMKPSKLMQLRQALTRKDRYD
jgi:hypothetical protein